MNQAKTALAIHINSRLSNSGNNGANIPMQVADVQPIVEPSAAGTLRLMTAQHNLPNSQGQQQPQPPQQQQQSQQQPLPLPLPQQFQVDPSAGPQFQRIQIQQSPGQKPMPQPNMIVTAQKPFPDNADQVK